MRRPVPGWDVERHYSSSEELCGAVRASHDTALLSFSCGKDSIAAWLRLREYGFRVIPYQLLLVPGLEFVETGIRYFEDWFQTPILRLTHPSFVRWLRRYTFQPPDRTAELWDLDLPPLKYADVEDHLHREYGRELPIAVGTRSADSPMRRTSIKVHGSVNPYRATFLPIYDWSTKATYAKIAEAGIKLPVDYEMFGRSFDGLDLRFLAPIRQRFPRDYATILEWFPLAALEFPRRGLCPQKPQK